MAAPMCQAHDDRVSELSYFNYTCVPVAMRELKPRTCLQICFRLHSTSPDNLGRKKDGQDRRRRGVAE